MEPYRVGAYARVSTLNQVLEHDSSIDTQVARIRQKVDYEAAQAKLTNDRSWVLVGEYREEGKSGKDTDRPQLQRLLADVRGKKLDAVVVTKIDRITRSLIDFYDLWKSFEENGVEFISLGDSFDSSSATGRAMLKLTLIFAELERERTSERTKEKIQMRRQAGKWFGGPVPLGYRVHPKDKTTLEIDPDTADLARGIFGLYLELKSARAVTQRLNQLGKKRPVALTQRGTEKGGGAFSTSSLIHMLSNLTYVAKRELDDGSIIDCSWPALVDQQVFDAAQARLAENSEKRPTGKESLVYVYLLEGLLRCGACGSMMSRASANGRNGQYYYYKCTKKHRTANVGCTVRDLPASAIEKFVVDQIRARALDPDAIKKAVAEANAGRDQGLAQVERELQEVRTAHQQVAKTLTKLLDALEGDDHDAGALKGRIREKDALANQLKVKMGELEAKRNALKDEILNAEVVAESYSKLPQVLDEAERAGAREELKALLQSVIDVVEWRQDPADEKRGEALLQLFPVPGLWDGNQRDSRFVTLSNMAPTTGLEPVAR
jgi:site-specific DNA recombinase